MTPLYFGERSRRVERDVGDAHARTFRGECPDDRFADALRRAGDERGPAFELHA